MKSNRIAAFAAAVCITGSSLAYAPGYIDNAAVYAADETISGTVELKIGQSVTAQKTSGSESPKWYSEDVTVATVDSNGTVTAVSEGETFVYAVFTSSKLKFRVIVSPAEEEDPKPAVTDLGTVNLDNEHDGAELKLNDAPEGDIAWTSSDTSVATVDSSGTIKAVGKGTCTISAVIGSNTYIVNVISTYEPTEEDITVVKAGSFALSNANPQGQIDLKLPEGTVAVWSSSNTDVAVVDENGLVKAVGKGTCTITAAVGKVRYIAELTSTFDPEAAPEEVILGDITLSSSQPSKKPGLTIPAGSEPVWSTSDANIAVPDEDGFITAKGSGTCRIIIALGGKNYILNVTSTYLPPEERPDSSSTVHINGLNKQVSLTVSGEASSPVWSSDNEAIVTVSQDGKVTSNGFGTTQVFARFENYVSAVTIVVEASNIPGDANCDYEVNMADAVLVMQAQANPDIYGVGKPDGITEQGVKNADVSGSGDGMTILDAQTIQAYKLGKVDKLPVD